MVSIGVSVSRAMTIAILIGITVVKLQSRLPNRKARVLSHCSYKANAKELTKTLEMKNKEPQP